MSATEEAGVRLERELVHRAAADPEAFGRLYDLYAPRVYSFAFRRLQCRADAEDIVSFTFEKALKSLGSFRSVGSSFGSWLFRIAGNLIYDLHRERQRAARAMARSAEWPPRARSGADETGEASPVCASESGPEATVVASEEAGLLWKLVRGLSEAQQEAVYLKYGAGLANTEIASATGRSETAVSSLLHRALTTLRERVGDGNV